MLIQNKIESTLISQILTGHIRIKFYIHRLNPNKSDKCPYCQTPETVEHILYKCCKEGLLQKYTLNLTEPDLLNELIHNQLIRKHVITSFQQRI